MNRFMKLRLFFGFLIAGRQFRTDAHGLMTRDLERAKNIAQHGACPYCEGTGVQDWGSP